MTVYPGLGRIVTDAAGAVDVLHRLALAVEPVDAVTERPLPGLRIGRETSRSLALLDRRRGRRPATAWARTYPAEPLVGFGPRFVLRHGPTIGDQVQLRIDDPTGRRVPRRFRVPLWTLDEVQAVDPAPGRPSNGCYVVPRARLLRPWLLPSSAHPVTPGVTGARLRLRLRGAAVPWARLEAVGADGLRAGWAQGNRHGEVLLLPSGTGLVPPVPATFFLAMRVHHPAPAPGDDSFPPTGSSDPFADLPVEQVARSANPPQNSDLDNDVLRGVTPPAGYVAVPGVIVVRFTVGEVVTAPDIVLA